MNLIKKYTGLSVQAKASIWYTVCNFFQKGISFIAVPIYVRLLTTAEYGEWAVFQSWAGILIVFASLNLYCGVFTKKMVDIAEAKERDKYTSCMQGLGTSTTIALLVVYFFIGDWANRVIGLDTGYMLLLFLYFIVSPAFSFWSTRQRVEYRYKSMVAVTAVVSVLTPALSMILLFYTDLRANALILGYLIIQCFVGLIFYIYHFIKGRAFFDKEYWQYAARFNIPLIPHYLSLIVLNESDRIMIKNYCGESDAGIYSFAYQIASAISVLISAINGSRVPWTYERLRERSFDRLKSITTALVISMAGFALLISLFSPEIIGILGTEKYGTAVYVIPVVTIGVYFTFVYDLYASIEFYYGATKFVMYASVTGAVINLALNAIFIPIYGFIAAAYTTLVCYVIFMFMHFIFSKKVLKQQKISQMIYNDRDIILISAFSTIICIGSMLLFKIPVIRFSVIGLLILISILKRKTIKKIVEEIRK